MRVQVGMPAAHGRHCQREAHHVVAVEGAEYLPANFLRHHEQPEWDQFRIAEIPNFLLQGNCSAEIFQFVALADLEGVVFHVDDFSRSFACCHRDSSSSRVACSGLRPAARSCSSTH